MAEIANQGFPERLKITKLGDYTYTATYENEEIVNISLTFSHFHQYWQLGGI